MATHFSTLAWGNPVDRGAWQASPQGRKESHRVIFEPGKLYYFNIVKFPETLSHNKNIFFTL